MKPTVTVPVQLYRCGHPTIENGYSTIDVTVNPHHGPVIKNIALSQSWDKYRKCWLPPQIYSETIRPLRPDGKKWRSILEYLHRDQHRRCYRRKDASKFDYSDNNVNFF